MGEPCLSITRLRGRLPIVLALLSGGAALGQKHAIEASLSIPKRRRRQ